MERDSVFLGRKNQYCENDCTTKCNLQFQCNPYQITNDIFHRTRTNNSNSYGNTKTQLAKAILELDESVLLNSDYITKLQSSRQYGIGTKPEIQTSGTR